MVETECKRPSPPIRFCLRGFSRCGPSRRADLWRDPDALDGTPCESLDPGSDFRRETAGAWVILRERINGRQWLGIFRVFIGVVVLSH